MNQIIKNYDQYFENINEKYHSTSKSLDVKDISFRGDGMKTHRSGYITFQEKFQDEITDTWTMYLNGRISFGHFYPADLQRNLSREINRFLKQENVLREGKKNWAPDKAQEEILVDTLKNPSKALLGNITVEECEKILMTKFKYTKAQIEKLKKSRINK